MIQYHPSLLPRYRGPSAINWAIALGETKTGLTIFRPSDGLDEGAVILQKEVAIGPNDSLGKVYFDHLFPLGIAALMEAADLVVAGKHSEQIQDESQANYEGWFDQAATRVYWTSHLQRIYDLIRAANPAPGAWTSFGGEKITISDAAKHVTRTYSAVRGKPGVITEIGSQSIFIACHGGEIEVLKAKSAKVANGSKVSGAELAAGLGLQLGQGLDLS
jgi:methionyl-tRNA formyltransferase